MKLYLAASVFSASDRERNMTVADRLLTAGHQIFLPQQIRTSRGQRPPALDIFSECVAELEHSDVVIGLIDGADVDSGTAWELGFAYARGKEIICLRTDYRSAEHGPVNIMIEFSSRLILANVPETTWSESLSALVRAVDATNNQG